MQMADDRACRAAGDVAVREEPAVTFDRLVGGAEHRAPSAAAFMVACDERYRCDLAQCGECFADGYACTLAHSAAVNDVAEQHDFGRTEFQRGGVEALVRARRAPQRRRTADDLFVREV